MVDGAMLRRRHEPRARIVRDARLGPLLERGDERILREVFRDADVADDARQTGDESGGLDPADAHLRWRAALAALSNRHESHGYCLERCLFFAMAARCRSSCWRSSGVNSAPKSSVSKNCRISTSPSWNGMRFAHSRASALFFTCQIQKPATSSLASVNGPSRTVRLLPAY